MKGTAAISKKQAGADSGHHQPTSSAAGVIQPPAHTNVVQSSFPNKQHPPEHQQDSNAHEQMKNEKSAGGYRKDPTDVHVVADNEHLILQQYLAEFSPLCEEDVQASY